MRRVPGAKDKLGVRLLTAFVIGFVTLTLEIAYTRVISFKLFYYYTYFVIGLALLGLGAASAVTALSPPAGHRPAPAWSASSPRSPRSSASSATSSSPACPPTSTSSGPARRPRRSDRSPGCSSCRCRSPPSSSASVCSWRG